MNEQQDLTEKHFKRFDDFISLDGNNSIVLSAPFGQGKTYFLTKFVDAHSSKYHFIKLFPLSYSVSSNQDIFELIKYDILIQILSDKDLSEKIKKEKFAWSLTAQMFILDLLSPENWVDKFASFLEAKSSAELKVFGTTIKELKKYHKSFQIDSKLSIEQFLKNIEKNNGSAYEFDALTGLISNCLSQTKKIPVLMVDDIDRLDPEHIFRILNILTSYSDVITGKNKLGFKKTIVVCDIENIRSVFHHRYGLNADFTGYMNKFYSHGIYEFSNQKTSLQIIKERTGQIRVQINKESITLAKGDSELRLLPDVVYFVCVALYYHNKISLRSVIQLGQVQLDQPNLNPTFNHLKSDLDIYGLWLILIINQLFPSKRVMMDAIQSISLSTSSIAEINSAVNDTHFDSHAIRLIELCLPWLIGRETVVKVYDSYVGKNPQKNFYPIRTNDGRNSVMLPYIIYTSGNQNHLVAEVEDEKVLEPFVLNFAFQILLDTVNRFLI